MSLASSRAVLRPWKLIGRTARRFGTTTAKGAEAGTGTTSNVALTAAEYKTKASEGLSRVTSSAGPAISGAAKSASSALGRVGGTTGRLFGVVESMYAHCPPVLAFLDEVFGLNG